MATVRGGSGSAGVQAAAEEETEKEERSEGRGGNIRVLLVCGLALQLYIEM